MIKDSLQENMNPNESERKYFKRACFWVYMN